MAFVVGQLGASLGGFYVALGIKHVGTGQRSADRLAGLRRDDVRKDKAGTRVTDPRLHDERLFVILFLDRIPSLLPGGDEALPKVLDVAVTLFLEGHDDIP